MAYVRVVAEIDEAVGDKAKAKAKRDQVAMKLVIQKLLTKWIKGEVQLW